MLDSGSEINILRLGFVKDKTTIDNTKITLIMGISKNPVLSLGTVNKKLLGQMVEFIVVLNNFQIPFSGILGSQLFLNHKAKLNFDDKTFILGDRVMDFCQNDNPYYEVEINAITNKITNNALNCLPFIEVFNPPFLNKGYFMIDSGSEANLIKLNLIPQNQKINSSDSILLKGICDEATKSLGAIEIKVYGFFSTF